MSERALTERYRLIRYHKRGWAGSTHTPPPVSIADHVAVLHIQRPEPVARSIAQFLKRHGMSEGRARHASGLRA